MVYHLDKMALVLVLFTSVILHQGHAFTCETSAHLSGGLAFAAATVTEVPVASTVMNLLTSIAGLFGNFCTSSSYLTQEDLRKWESEFVGNAIKGFKERMERMKDANLAFERCVSSASGSDKHCYDNHHEDLIDHLTGLSRAMSDARFTHFDSRPHYWKMESLAAYGIMELNVLNLLINKDDKHNKREHERSYGRVLTYYLQRGTEYYQKYVMEQFPKERGGGASVRARKASLANLQPALLEWIKQAEENPETRRRLKMVTAVPFYNPFGINLKMDIFPQIGVYHHLMPDPIKDNDWVALKCTSHQYTLTEEINRHKAWLSCWGSIDDDDWCEWRSCSNLLGNQGDDECLGERFRIQNVHGNEITIGNKVAFKYESLESGDYWLSYKDAWTTSNYGKPQFLETLWVSRCPGSTFTKSDIHSCDKEVFTITHGPAWQIGQNKNKIVRNGDLVELGLDNLRVKGHKAALTCFIVKQNKQVGDKGALSRR